jgi:hypothetical protein
VSPSSTSVMIGYADVSDCSSIKRASSSKAMMPGDLSDAIFYDLVVEEDRR